MVDANQDLPGQLAGVVLRFGRPMVALVYGAGMASEAVKVLANVAQRSRDQGVMHAVSLLAGTYNEISSAYARTQGWTEEELNSCNSAITQAFATRLVDAQGKLL